jgi:hypothetical protein
MASTFPSAQASIKAIEMNSLVVSLGLLNKDVRIS